MTNPQQDTLAEPVEEGQSATITTPVPSWTASDQIEDLDTSKLRSSVWLHMHRKKINNDIKVVCKYCGATLAASSKSGTHHLHSHIKSCLEKNRNEEENTTIAKFDQGESRKNLVEMVVLHEHPLSIVEQVGFKKFVKSLQPLFKVPSRATVRRDIMKLYTNRMKETMHLLERNKGRIAITTDMWTADNQKKSYMAVTAHFVDDSWRLQQRILRFQYVPAPHTIKVLAKKMMEILLDWNLDSKLSTITVDNCSVNDGFIKLLVHNLKNEHLLLKGEFFHMRCCAHILNLIVKDGIEVIGEGLERIRSSCVFWSSTPKKIEMFEAEAQLLHINGKKKLCSDVKTRWNSTFLMLETALIYKEVFRRLQFRDPQYKTIPTDEDWENAKLVNEKLRIFFTITELFSGTSYTTANHYFPKICEIRLALMEWISDPNPKIAQMATKMFDKFKKYWSVIHGFMGVATILDPRCKKELLEYYYLKIYGRVHFEREVDEIMVFFRRLFREYLTRGSHDQIEESAMEDRMRKSDLPKDFLLSRRKKIRVEDELNLYINEDLVDADSENFNVLSWWMTNGKKYSTLQKIAQDVFAIPVSMVASESAFSMGGRVISPLRNRLHPKLVEALACAQSWLRAEYQDSGDHNQFRTFCDDEDEDEDEDQDISIVDENVDSTSEFFMRRLVGETSTFGDENDETIM